MDCKKCNGTKSYMYDEIHGTVCDECCAHDQGWFELCDGHGTLAGELCCKAGCGHVLEKADSDARANYYWQDKLAKFFPKSKGPTSVELDMFRAGYEAAWHEAQNKKDSV